MYKMCTYRISVSHEICKTKDNREVSSARTACEAAPLHISGAEPTVGKREVMQEETPGPQAHWVSRFTAPLPRQLPVTSI